MPPKKQQIVNSSTGEIMVYQALGEIALALALVAEEMEGEEFNPTSSLPRIKIPTGGATTWEVPTLEGAEAVKELVGIPLWESRQRVYWARSFEETGGGQLPDCHSPDGKLGVGAPGGNCRECPMNQWDTAPKGTGGKACKQVRMIALLTPEELIPFIVVATPGSIAQVNGFFVRLKARRIQPHQAVISLALHQATNRNGLKYAQISPRLIGVLDTDSQLLSGRLREAWLPTLEQTQPDREAVEGPGETDLETANAGYHHMTDPEGDDAS